MTTRLLQGCISWLLLLVVVFLVFLLLLLLLLAVHDLHVVQQIFCPVRIYFNSSDGVKVSQEGEAVASSTGRHISYAEGQRLLLLLLLLLLPDFTCDLLFQQHSA